MSNKALAWFSTRPFGAPRAVVLRTIKLPLPPQTTVPALVSGLHKDLLAAPIRFNTPFVATVKLLPVTVPFCQLNCPLTVTGAVRLIVPPKKLMVSLTAGTPAGVQLLALNQSLLTDPFQVFSNANSAAVLVIVPELLL